MSRRNPMNDRYMNVEQQLGKTRKSAASAKPKSKAGSSVHVAPAGSSAGKKKDEKEKRSLSLDSLKERREAKKHETDNLGPRAREKYLQQQYVLWNNRRRRMIILAFVALFVAIIYRYSVPEPNFTLEICLWILPFLFIGIGIWMSFAKQRPIGRILGIAYGRQEQDERRKAQIERHQDQQDINEAQWDRVEARYNEKVERDKARQEQRAANRAAQAEHDAKLAAARKNKGKK